MLIHELAIAAQRDRERTIHATLTARRHLAQVCRAAPIGLFARLRAIGRPATPTARARGTSRVGPRSA